MSIDVGISILTLLLEVATPSQNQNRGGQHHIMEEEKVGVSDAIKSIGDGITGETAAPTTSNSTSSSSSSVQTEVELVQSRLHSPIIDPDEEINEDDAFNSEDELLYAEFFPRSRSNSTINPGALNMNNMTNNATAAAFTMPPQQQHHNITLTNNTPHGSIIDNSSSGSGRMETRRSAAFAAAVTTHSNADYLVNTNPTVVVENNNTTLRRYSMTTRSRSSSIAIDDHGSIGGGGSGGRSRIFSIDFDREYFVLFVYYFCTHDISTFFINPTFLFFSFNTQRVVQLYLS
jgi:hypothetical protein